MGIDSASCNDPEKAMLVLLMLFKGLLEHTFSGDAKALSVYRATDLLEGIVDKEEVWEISQALFAAARRRPQPLDKLF